MYKQEEIFIWEGFTENNGKVKVVCFRKHNCLLAAAMQGLELMSQASPLTCIHKNGQKGDSNEQDRIMDESSKAKRDRR